MISMPWSLKTFTRVPPDEPTNAEVHMLQSLSSSHSRFGCAGRAGVIAVTVAIAIVIAVAWKPWCLHRIGGSFIALDEVTAADRLEFDPIEDQSALSEFLSTPNSDAPDGLSAELRAAAQKVTATDDQAEARTLVNAAINRAVNKSRARRRSLQKVIEHHRAERKMRGHGKHRERKRGRSPQQKTYSAHCAFDTLTALNSIGFVAANINDAYKTCGGVDTSNLLSKNNTHSKVCGINIAFAFGQFANLISQFSLAANDCTATLVPNVDALCSAGVTGLLSTFGQMAGSSAMIAASCDVDKMRNEIPIGTEPSNFGSDEVYKAVNGRRLQENATSAPAPARSLLYGGGPDSITAQCGLQVSGVLWALGQAATFMAQADKGSIGPMGQCPPKNVAGGSKIKGPVYNLEKTYCAHNVAGILLAYAKIAAFLQEAVVNCADALNLKAICGAGVAGLVGSIAGLAEKSANIKLSCDIFQDKRLKKAIRATGNLDKIAGLTISEAIGGGHPFGRRLSSVEEERPMHEFPTVRQLEARFGTPVGLFKSLGLDIEDSSADFRNQDHFQGFRSAVRDVVQEHSLPSGGLFYAAATCPA